MKKILLILLIISSGLSAQKYVPFPTENAQWNVFYASTFSGGKMDTILLKYSLQGDTTINSVVYRKLCRNIGTDALPIYKRIGRLREQDKKVYYMGLSYAENAHSGYGYEQECLLYDFNKQVGDTVLLDERSTGAWKSVNYVILNIDSVKIGNEYRKRYRTNQVLFTPFTIIPTTDIIEGIGNVQSGLFGKITSIPTCLDCHQEWHFVCFSQNGESVYKNPDYVDCNSTQKLYAAINNPVMNTQITVSPNPVMGSSIIKWNVSESNQYTTLVITDILGKSIKTINVSGKTEINISRSDFTKGLYIARLVTDRGSETTVKIIVQ